MVPRELLSRVLLLASLFALVALATSRLVLVGHEFVGHAATAMLVGGDVVDHRLFLFGGGWVITRTPNLELAGSLLISLGGLSLELVLAIGLALLSTRRGPLRHASFVTSAALSICAGLCLIHVGVYLGLGTHEGYGDGRTLHHVLGELRVIVVIAACALAVFAGFWLGRRTMAIASRVIGGSLVRKTAAAGVAAVLAAGIHGGLMLAEQAITSDPTYAEVMRSEASRKARQLAARAAAARRDAGTPMSNRERAALTDRLERERRPLPIRFPVYAVIALAAMVGARRGHRANVETSAPLKWRSLVPVALITAAAIVAVAVLHVPWWR